MLLNYKIKKERKNMNKLDKLKTLEAVHTHTHTSIFSEQNWEQGGSREHRDVVILPHRCE